MSSWREKLANKTTTAVTSAPQAMLHQGTLHQGTSSDAAMGSWKQRINDKQTHPEQTKPLLPKVSVDDLNDFPALGGTPSLPKKQAVLTGFASLARDWSVHDKEEKQREEKERIYREQQENAYNYNISKLNAINNRVMAFNTNAQYRYDDEYNADYENDLNYHNDEL